MTTDDSGVPARQAAPLFYMPFPPGLNPAMNESRQQMEAWSDKHGLRPTTEARRQREKSRPELYIARSFPDAASDSLTLITEWIEWGFVIDDELDDGPLGRCVAHCATAVADLLAALDEPSPAGTPIARAGQDLWRRTLPGRSTAWLRRLHSDIQAWLWTYHTETVQRATGYVPDIEEYRIHCRNAAGMLWFMDLYELAVNVDMPDSIAFLPSFTAMRLAAVEHAAFLNDILSIPKESPLGIFHNAVTIFIRRDEMTADAAVAAVNDLTTQCVHRYMAARRAFDDEIRHVPGPPDLKHGATRCADGIAALMRGIHDWHLEVDRYRTIVAPPEKPDYLTGAFQSHRTAAAAGDPWPGSRR
ncbi:MAG: terpene synthase family protein [Acidimicrobiales bacterium]